MKLTHCQLRHRRRPFRHIPLRQCMPTAYGRKEMQGLLHSVALRQAMQTILRVQHRAWDLKMTAVGFEPAPFRTGAWSKRLRPLGQTVSATPWAFKFKEHHHDLPRSWPFRNEVILSIALGRIACQGQWGTVICMCYKCMMCRDTGSNWGPSDLQLDALPPELSRLLRLRMCAVCNRNHHGTQLLPMAAGDPWAWAPHIVGRLVAQRRLAPCGP